MNALEGFSMLDGYCRALAGVALVHALQTLLVLGSALVLIRLLRRNHPAVRHVSLLLVFLSQPLLPLLTRFIETSGLLAGLPALLPAPEFGASRVFLTTAGSAAAPLPAAPAAALTVAPAGSTVPFPWLLAAAFLLGGAVICLAPLVACRLRIMRLRWSGRRVDAPETAAVIRRAARQLGLSRRVRIIEHPGVRSPFTAGFLRPAVFLPAEFTRALSQGELHEVALHELAHVRRGDSLTLTMVALLRSLYFWNPLAWIAAGHIARLAEEACDDAVLRRTGNPVRYAKMLTSMAEKLPSRRFAMESPAGIMIPHSSFRRRIETILDSGRRLSVNRFPRLKFTMFLALVLLTVAAAVSAPALTAADRSDDTGEHDGSGLSWSFDRLEPKMTIDEVKAILGPPDDTVEVEGRADLALVWTRSRFLLPAETVVVAFREGRSVLQTHSSRPILNVRKHVEEALAGDPGLSISEAKLRRLEEVERMDGVYLMRNSVAAMLAYLETSGAEAIEVDPENASRFDGVEIGISYDEAVEQFGPPRDVDVKRGGTCGTWRWSSDTVTLWFENGVLVSKTFETAGREVLVEEDRWRATAGRTQVTVIED